MWVTHLILTMVAALGAPGLTAIGATGVLMRSC